MRKLGSLYDIVTGVFLTLRRFPEEFRAIKVKKDDASRAWIYGTTSDPKINLRRTKYPH